ncbi:MAG: CDP-alcohol phosphatidyltransferase family protein [Oscillospiraceae bacterium]|nr:CDP-alcohol phosphatidyltransferase family protein [Oscillospiraceae bacterium]
MIGFYDYTVVLTYTSVFSAVTGIALCFSGHPYWAVFCLLFCGLCDAFDGRVARAKKNRTEDEKRFGIQIDSLSDLIAFGVLPACLVISICRFAWYGALVAAFYVLAALIRLAYFNVTEELRQQAEADAALQSYSGLPVTSASLIFPILTCIVIPFHDDRPLLRVISCAVMLLTGLLFVLPFKLRKPNQKEIWLLIALGALIAVVLVLILFVNPTFIRGRR